MTDVAEYQTRLKQALVAMQKMRARLDEVEQARTEPLAIVGIGCRFPGGVNSPEDYWQLLHGGVDAICDVPPQRWDMARYYDPDPDAPGKMYVRQGGFLQDVDLFDPHFFGIAPREANSMDPQQRLFLEVVWEALEHAGIPPEKIRGSQTGVFAGITASDYMQLHARLLAPEEINAYLPSGNVPNVTAGRVSYLLGLHGPSMALDTACSSSLVAIHMACQSVRSGESRMAIAGGVNLMLVPEITVSFCRWGMLSHVDRCKTFDAQADGFVRGEGCGVVIIKRLSDALADGDNVLALIRGSAANQDGPSSGLSVPNGLAQQAVIRQALQNAGVEPQAIRYVETHGTGTTLGDPIEVEALGAVLCRNRPAERPLAIGAVKTNIGHLEAASGAAGLIKTVLALYNEEIPPHLHLQTPSPHIRWESLPIEIPTQSTPWPRGSEPRLAGVSAFGFSGTNVHIVLQEAPQMAQSEEKAGSSERPLHLLPLSAKSEAALRQLAGCYARHFAAHPELSLADAAFTAAAGRTHFENRLAVVGDTLAGVAQKLAAFAAGETPADTYSGAAARGRRPRIVFLFTGQEAQLVNMGQQLYETQPTFRAALDECDHLLRPYLERPLPSILFHSQSTIHNSQLTIHAALFALQYALARLWQSWGVQPAALLGHGIGEYVAACLAGVFSLEDGLKLVIARSSPPELERLLYSVTFHAPRLSLLSGATGRPAGPEVQTPAYWREQPTRSAVALDSLFAQEDGIFLEIGSHPYLLETAHRLPAVPLPGGADWQHLLPGLAALYVQGVAIDWAAYDGHYQRRRLSLPTYPFQRERYWLVPTHSSPFTTHHSQFARVHPLLGRRLHSPLLQGTVFEAEASTAALPFLADHVVQGLVVMPATAYVEAALAAARELRNEEICVLADLQIDEALILASAEGRLLQTAVTGADDGDFSFQVLSLDPGAKDATFTRHASGRILPAVLPPAPTTSLADVQARCLEQLPVDAFYRQFAARGVDFGASFRGITALWRREGEALGRIEWQGAPANQYLFHPGLLDACWQVFAAAWPAAAGLGHNGASESHLDTYMPVSIGSFRISHRAGERLWSRAALRESKNGRAETLMGDIDIYDENGRLVAQVEGLLVKRAARGVLQRRGETQPEWLDWLYEVAWQPQPRRAAPQAAASGQRGAWLLFADEGGIAVELAQLLRQHGEYPLLVRPGTARGEVEAGVWEVDPAQPGSFRHLLAAVGAGDQLSLRGVVYLWSLDSVLPEGATVDELAVRQARLGGGALSLVQALATASLPLAPRLWLVTGGAQPVGDPSAHLDVAQASLWGLGKTIALEHPELHCTRIDLDAAVPGAAKTLFAELWQPDDEDQIALRRDARYVARLVRRSAAAPEVERPLQLAATTPGLLDSLTWQESKRQPPGRGEIEIRVHATGLNFRDVLNALDMYPGDAGPLGGECAGEVVAVGPDVFDFTPGDAVIAIAPGSFSTFVTTRAALAVAKPHGLSDAAAATLLSAYMTAYHALYQLGRLAAGERVLIHAAAGGVGMAAVRLAQQAGAEIFATAGSPEKRDFLRSLGVAHVFDSRSLAFAGEIMAVTGGAGVDVALNSLADDFVPQTLSVLAANGRFLEIGKRGIWTPQQVAAVKPQAEYHVIDLAAKASTEPAAIRQILRELMALFADGALLPLPHQTFTAAEAQEAFRTMAQARHIGKIVVTQPASRRGVPVRADATYLISGGLAGLGLLTAEWLVDQGAQHLALLGRSGASAAVRERIVALEQRGVQVIVAQADVSQLEQVEAVLAQMAQTMPPLRGVIHSAGVLDDGALLQHEWARFETVFAPKVYGGWLLHTLTRQLPLDFFVLYSSGSALLGSPGQGNHAAANSFLDTLAHHRRALGLPGLSINWGVWSQTGAAARQGVGERLAERGIGAISPEQGIEALAHLLREQDEGVSPQAGVFPVEWTAFARHYPVPTLPPFFDALVTTAVVAESPSPRPSQPQTAVAEEPPLLQQLSAAPPHKRPTLLQDHVRTRALKVLGLDSARRLDPQQPLQELGLDSLMAVELRNLLGADLGLKRPLPATLVFDYPSTAAISDYLAREVLAWSQEAPASAPAPDQSLDELERLSENEAEALLLAELGALKKNKK